MEKRRIHRAALYRQAGIVETSAKIRGQARQIYRINKTPAEMGSVEIFLVAILPATIMAWVRYGSSKAWSGRISPPPASYAVMNRPINRLCGTACLFPPGSSQAEGWFFAVSRSYLPAPTPPLTPGQTGESGILAVWLVPLPKAADVARERFKVGQLSQGKLNKFRRTGASGRPKALRANKLTQRFEILRHFSAYPLFLRVAAKNFLHRGKAQKHLFPGRPSLWCASVLHRHIFDRYGGGSQI